MFYEYGPWECTVWSSQNSWAERSSKRDMPAQCQEVCITITFSPGVHYKQAQSPYNVTWKSVYPSPSVLESTTSKPNPHTMLLYNHHLQSWSPLQASPIPVQCYMKVCISITFSPGVHYKQAPSPYNVTWKSVYPSPSVLESTTSKPNPHTMLLYNHRLQSWSPLQASPIPVQCYLKN